MDKPVYSQAFERSIAVEKQLTGLIEEDAVETPRFPESIFVRDFLPKFANSQVMEDPKLRAELISQWRYVARNLGSPVSLRDAAGNHVIMVPPVMDTTLYKSAIGDNVFDHVFDEFVTRDQSPLGFSQQHLNQSVLPTALSNVTPTENKWIPVFEHYGIKTRVSSGKNESASLSADPAPDSFEIED